MAQYAELVRFLVTFSVAGVSLYFKIKAAKVNGIYKRTAGTIVGGAKARASAHELIMVRRKSSTPFADHLPDGSTQSIYELVQDSTQSNLPQMDTRMRFYDMFQRVANWYLFGKNILICLLRHKSFAHLRYLDCLLLGRLAANGRAIELAPYCACYETLTWLIWNSIMLRRTPEFKLSCVEFLLDRERYELFWLRNESVEAAEPEYHSALLEYQDPFEMYPEKLACQSTTRKPPFKLRPNRTREAWNKLARATLLYYAISATIFVGALGHFLAMGLPVAVTRRGFALNYRICIQWLAAKTSSPNATNSYGHFLGAGGGGLSMFTRAQLVRDFFMPFTDFVSLNLFHSLRIILEALETLFIYMGVCVGFNFGLFITIIMSKDVLCYSQSIVSRMERSVAALRLQQDSQPWDLYDPRGQKRDSYCDKIDRALSTRKEISDIQAQISDMFTMLDSYNKYMSLQCLCFLIFWLQYSAMISSWLFLPGNNSSKLEWYAILGVATVYSLTMLNFMTQVKTSCSRLYNLISSAMALGEGNRCEMDVWISLLSYYKPRPMYCFTMLGSIELTYLSGIKLLVWLFSALIIASSFFKVHNVG